MSFHSTMPAVAAVALSFAAAQPQALAADPSANLAFQGCNEQTSLLVVPQSLLPPLPAGFTYGSPAGEGLMGEIHISTSSCRSVNGVPTPDAHEVFAFALVNPPAALTSPDVPFYAVALGGYSNRPETLAQFEAWGIADLLKPATVTVQLNQMPLLGVGKAKAVAATSRMTAQMAAAGSVQDMGGGRSRAFYVHDGRVVASFDALYTNQPGVYAAGTVVLSGDAFLPAGVYPSVGSQAFGYDMTVGFVQYY